MAIRVSVPFTFAFYPPFEIGGELVPVIAGPASLFDMDYCGYCDGKPLGDPLSEDDEWTPCTEHETPYPFPSLDV